MKILGQGDHEFSIQFFNIKHLNSQFIVQKFLSQEDSKPNNLVKPEAKKIVFFTLHTSHDQQGQSF